AKNSTTGDAGQMKNRFAQGLAGNGAGVDGCATKHVVLLDNDDALTKLGGLNSRLLARGAGPDDGTIKMSHGFRPTPKRFGRRDDTRAPGGKPEDARASEWQMRHTSSDSTVARVLTRAWMRWSDPISI